MIWRKELQINARPTFDIISYTGKSRQESKTSVVIRTNFPSVNRQFSRLQPTFNVLRTAFEQKAVAIQQSPVGINPDFALVLKSLGQSIVFIRRYNTSKDWNGFLIKSRNLLQQMKTFIISTSRVKHLTKLSTENCTV